MICTLHIERHDADGAPVAISLEEWIGAVSDIDGVRMAKGDARATNPLTDQEIVIPNRGGDAEVYQVDYDGWLRALWWSPRGAVTFAPTGNGEAVMAAARALAGKLGAQIRDDDGEACD